MSLVGSLWSGFGWCILPLPLCGTACDSVRLMYFRHRLCSHVSWFRQCSNWRRRGVHLLVAHLCTCSGGCVLVTSRHDVVCVRLVPASYKSWFRLWPSGRSTQRVCPSLLCVGLVATDNPRCWERFYSSRAGTVDHSGTDPWAVLLVGRLLMGTTPSVRVATPYVWSG